MRHGHSFEDCEHGRSRSPFRTSFAVRVPARSHYDTYVAAYFFLSAHRLRAAAIILSRPDPFFVADLAAVAFGLASPICLQIIVGCDVARLLPLNLFRAMDGRRFYSPWLFILKVPTCQLWLALSHSGQNLDIGGTPFWACFQ